MEAILSLWTRKEALLKAIGLGVANHLKEVSVFFDNDARIELGRGLTAEDWTVRTMASEEEIWSIAVPFQNPELTISVC